MLQNQHGFWKQDFFFDMFSDVLGEVVYVASGAVYENTPKHAEFLSNFHRSFAICGSS